jgi:hypothetical protein
VDAETTKTHIAALTEMLSEERRMLGDLEGKRTAAAIWRREQGESRIAALEAAIKLLEKAPHG